MNLHQHNTTTTARTSKGAFALKVSFFCLLSLVLLTGLFAFGSPKKAEAATAVNTGSVEAQIRQVFGPHANAAINVARCESGLNPGARNSYSIGGSNAAGVFQILYPSTWYGTSQAGASPYNSYANIVAAHEIFVRDGYSWREWQCQP